MTNSMAMLKINNYDIILLSSYLNIFGHFDLILTYDFDRFDHKILILSIHSKNFDIF